VKRETTKGYELFTLEALDSWFFREPRPFHADESVAGGMDSLFPPPCRTVAGTLRAALGRAAGWNGHGRWPQELESVLGDGEDLGGLRFLGPVLARGEAAYYPLPRQVIGRQEERSWRAAAVLAPGDPVDCDLETARLPDAVGWRTGDLAGTGPPDGWWGTAAALGDVLAGRPPDAAAVIALDDLVAMEERVGIRRDRATRTAADDALYAARHARPADGVSIVAGVAGLPVDWPRPAGGLVVPFGGEGRAAVLRPAVPAAFPSRSVPAAQHRGYSVTFLTPVFLPAAAWQAGTEVPGLPGKVVSACFAEPIRLGGWNTDDRRAVPARSAVPAGGTLFMELDEHGAPDALLDLHGNHFDPEGQGRWGYGRMAVGAWGDGGSQGGPR
jgi:CRISPR-associated protein Cmr3